MIVRKATISDREEIAELYRTVAKNVVGISRRPHEITDTYVYSLLNKKPSDIVCLVAVDDDSDRVVGVVHGIKYGLEVYAHILADLTVIVHPDYQSQGVGRQLSMALLEHIFNHRPDILRVEMEVLHILKLVDTFELAGFVKEGEAKKRIKNADGTLSDSILMSWFNPNFKG